MPKPSAALQAEPETGKQPAASVPANPDPTRQTVTPVVALDKAAAEELGALLDEKIRRKKRRHRIEAMVTSVVMIGLSVGSAAWFVQSPDRVHAFVSAIAGIRSVGDVKSIVAKYQQALDRVNVRGQQIEEAAKAMGITSSGMDENDPYFDAEMKQMMGGEGKTLGQRAGQMQQAFGKEQEKHTGSSRQLAAALSEEDSFGWNP